MTLDTTVTEYTAWWQELLTLSPAGADRFTADPGPRAFPRLYGGTLVGQGIVAAASTVDDRFEVNSAHARYGHAGDPTVPLEYLVERLRDTRTLSARSVRAAQDGRLLADVHVSFHDPVAAAAGGGALLRHDSPGPATPDPQTLATRQERLAARFGPNPPPEAAPRWPVDTRYVDRAPWDVLTPDTPRAPANLVWLRAFGALPAVPATHVAALGYATDLPMFEPMLFPHDIDWELLTSGRTLYGASLDHTLWLHRPVRFDEWLLLDQVAPVADRSRGFCRGELRDRTGALVASLAQEIAFVQPRR